MLCRKGGCILAEFSSFGNVQSGTRKADRPRTGEKKKRGTKTPDRCTDASAMPAPADARKNAPAGKKFPAETTRFVIFFTLAKPAYS